MLRAKLRPKWGQHGSQVPLQEQLVQNANTFKNTVGSFKNEASRLATWQQQGCEKAKNQYQEAMEFEVDFVIGFGAVWVRFWRPTWAGLHRLGPLFPRAEAPGAPPIIKTGTKYQD